MFDRGPTLLRNRFASFQRVARRPIWALAPLIFLVSAPFAPAKPAVFESFDGPDPLWQLLDPRPGVKILAHASAANDAREGTGSEQITLNAPAGESVHFSCSVGRVPVLDELEARMWVKSNRPGVTLGARVVLPRTVDPSTHRPKTVLIEGTQYDQVGSWQQLSLSGVPKLVAARVRVLRTSPGTVIDPHEAYLDAITLTVPGGPSATAVGTDELAVDGIVVTAPETDTPTSDTSTSNAPGRRTTIEDDAVTPAAFAPASNVSAQNSIELRDTTLFVACKPFLPRVIEWRGESLAFLAERGFNAVWLDKPPTADQTAEAQRADVWLICTPPRPDALAALGLGRSLDRVLAWSLGTPGERELDYFRGWAELVRQKDPVSHRPILVAPQSDWLPCSKIADVLLIDHPASANLSDLDFAQWFDDRVTLARPGTPIWACLPTQPGEAACRQIAAVAKRSQSLPTIEAAQLETLVRTSSVHNCRGFLFRSTTPLNANDEAARRRALIVELNNRRLQIIEPWLTLGKNVGSVSASGYTASATILQVERSRLLVPDLQTTSVASPTAASAMPATTLFVVPGVPDSNQAYLLSSTALKPLASKRVAGGSQISVNRNNGDFVLLTEDPIIIANFRDRVSRAAPKTARLERDLAADRVRSASAELRNFNQLGANPGPYQAAISAANEQLAKCDTLLTSGNFDEALSAARAASASLAAIAAAQRQIVNNSTALTSLPWDGRYSAFPQQLDFRKSIQSLRPGANLLSGGQFEQLGQLMQLGWQNASMPMPGVVPNAELSTDHPHSGAYCLQLAAVAAPPSAAPQIVARPLLRISSPPLQLPGDSLVEISGWVRVPQTIVGNIDGLTIVDSLGGPELALHIRNSPDWQPFRLIRGTTDPAEVTLSFVLTGLGSASIDDVAVAVLGQPTARRLPTTASTSSLPLYAPSNQR